MPKVTQIDKCAFQDCSDLVAIHGPKVAKIGVRAFCDCLSLQSVDMPNVTQIGKHAFSESHGSYESTEFIQNVLQIYSEASTG